MSSTELSQSALTEHVIRLQAQVEQLQQRSDALQLVVSWLLAKHPDDAAMRFLSSQANEFEDSLKFEEEAALLDELREDVAQWHAQWSS